MKLKLLFTLILFTSLFFIINSFIESTTLNLWKRVLIEVSREKVAEIHLKKRHQVREERTIKSIVKRVGPEETLRMLNESVLPKDATSHFLSHKIGEETYRIYGSDSLVRCVFDDLNGCVHGLIIAAVEELGFDGVVNLTNSCKEVSPYKFKMCIHGAGHAFLALHNYDIYKAINFCNLLANEYEDNKNITQWCSSGLFMENVHGEHNGITPKDHPYLDRNNLMYPCTEIPEEYKKACYQTIAGWWNIVFEGDLVKTANLCSQVPVKYQPDCADNIGRLANSEFGNNIEKIEEYCLLLKGSLYNHCLKAEARNLFSVGQREIPFELCSKISSITLKTECYEGIYNDIQDSLMKDSEYSEMCLMYEELNPELCR